MLSGPQTRDNDNGTVDAACIAWNRLRAEAGRITSLCSYPWIEAIKP
jgi:hypothetical protein